MRIIIDTAEGTARVEIGADARPDSYTQTLTIGNALRAAEIAADVLERAEIDRQMHMERSTE